jgi:ABC-2 type transport system permease protein
MSAARGEVFDIGYQRYAGPREGRARARMALWVDGVRTAIGLGRGWPAKVLPALLLAAVVLPALFMSLGAAGAQPGDEIPTNSDYYRLIGVVVFLFSATIAPELLCPDRRDRVIDLYLVRPITPTDYVAARWAAFLSVTLALVWVGQLVLFAGLTLADDEALEYLRDNWLDVPRLLGAGLAVALFATTLPLAASTFTTRRAYAAALIIALYLVSLPVAGVLSLCGEEEGSASSSGPAGERQCEPVTGDAAKWFALLSLPEVPLHVSDLVFGDESGSEFAERVRENPAAVPVAWYVLLTGGSGLLLWWRYRRLVA